MSRASDYGKMVASIFNKTIGYALFLVTILGILYGAVLLHQQISTKWQMQMAIEQTILVYGAIFLFLGFVATLIVCTIMFFFWPNLVKEKKQQTIENVTRRYNRRFKKLEDEIALLKEPAVPETHRKPAVSANGKKPAKKERKR